MNWQYYYQHLRNIQKTHTTQQYCLEFLQLTQYQGDLLSTEEISHILSSMPSINHPNFNLFPFSENSKKIFDNGEHHLIAQIVFHLPYLDLTWMNLGNPSEYDLKPFYSTLFGNSTQSFLYLNNISIGDLLKNKTDEHIITYLFILCLPDCEKDTHLWDFNQNHICSIPFITDINYNMLIEISLDSMPLTFQQLCSQDKNLSILLIENFIDIQTELIDFKNIIWKEHFPIYQLFQLAHKNCYPHNFEDFLEKRQTILFPNLISFINLFKHELLEHVLEQEIPSHSKEEKISKF